MASGCSKRFVGIFMIFIALLSDFNVASSPVYPYNASTVNFIRASENNRHMVNLSVPIVYLGKAYNQFYISKDGFVSLGEAKAFRSQDWSAPDVSPFIDTPFIAPYYFDAQNLDSISDYHGAVTFQELSTEQIVKSNISQYIQSQVIGAEEFTADWVMEITWLNVTSGDQIRTTRCAGTETSPCPSNTFQLVLLTDGGTSYAIFNYGEMNKPKERYDQAGFNGGHGIGWTNILTSGMIDQLSRQQGSDTMGRYIFKISSGQVFRGGCSIDPQHTELSIYPSYAGMYGGKMIDISGPCFSDTSNIMCRFGKPTPGGLQPPVVRAIYMSLTRVRCMVPRLFIRDRIELSVSLNGQGSYNYHAPLTIVYPHRMPSSEQIEAVHNPSSGSTWYSKDPTSMTLKWAGKLLSNDLYALVDIRLIGYRESNGKSEYKPLATLGTNIRASDSGHTINAKDLQCVQQDCFNFEIGLLTVTLQDRFVPNSYKSMSSNPIPLGWWVQNAMTEKHGSDWPTALCVDWYNRDRANTEWTQDLLHCPCSVEQALADFGRWQPDMGCNLMNKAGVYNCYYHKDATHCVRSVQPVNGAGNQCCYGKTGQLIFAQDTFQGSTPDRSHDWGAAPYGKPGYVPSLSHWVDDVVSFYYCCLWTGYNSCDYYMDLRPTRDCTGYSPPIVASVYGQGHVMPFGGPEYNFRVVSPGDYVLLRAGNTTIQARFSTNLFPTADGSTPTAVYSLIGVAVQDTWSSDTVELVIRGPQNNNDQKKIDVKVNGDLVQFNDEALAWHDFNGVAVVNTDRKRMAQSNFTVILSNGIGLQVAEVAHTLQMDVMVPVNTFENVSGLFGDLDGNFQNRNGSYVDVRNLMLSSINIYKMFEINWVVTNKSHSLFQEFTPTALPRTITEPTPVLGSRSTTSICSYNKECAFDYKYTGSLEIARGTKQAAERLDLLRHYIQPVRSCGLLDVPRSSKNNYNYTLGTTTTITSCRAGSLSGPSTYMCQATSNETQEWSPAVTATCKEITEEANIGLIVGIAVGVILGLVIFIAIIVILVRRSSSRTTRTKKRKAVDGDSEEEREAMKTAV